MKNIFSSKTLKAACSALALTLAVSTAVNEAQAAYQMRVYSSLPADDQSSHYVWFKNFEEKLKAKVGDEVKLHYFANGMLGKEADACQQVKMGAIQIMISEPRSGRPWFRKSAF